MFSPQARAEIAGSLRLSGRELHIVRSVLDDLEELTIARALGVSVHTIHTHVERLHQKLGIADRAQPLQRVMQEFLALTTAPGNGLRRSAPTKPWGDVPSARNSAGRFRP